MSCVSSRTGPAVNDPEGLRFSAFGHFLFIQVVLLDLLNVSVSSWILLLINLKDKS